MLGNTNLLFYRKMLEKTKIYIYNDETQKEIDYLENEPDVIDFHLNLRYLYVHSVHPKDQKNYINVFNMSNFQILLYQVCLNQKGIRSQVSVCHNFPTVFYWSTAKVGKIASMTIEQQPSESPQLHSNCIPIYVISQSRKYLLSCSRRGTTYRIFSMKNFEMLSQLKWAYKQRKVSSMDICGQDTYYLVCLEDGYIFVSYLEGKKVFDLETSLKRPKGIFLNQNDLFLIYDADMNVIVYQIDAPNYEAIKVFKTRLNNY
jgi:hypothetical protein